MLGRAPYGYRYVGRREAADGTARFAVVEDEAAVVRRMFQWVAQERVSLAVVCQRLFEAGVPSPTGNARWRESMVAALLTNPAYAGQARFGRLVTAPWQPPLRPPRGRAPIPKHPRRRALAPADQWITIPVPALIDAALFEGTQEQLGENRRRRRQRKGGRALPAAGPAGLSVLRLCALWPLEGVLASAGAGIPLLPLHRDGQPSLRRPASVRC
jgi:site-specific DNA recombinase